MAKSVLLSDAARRELLDLVIEEGGGRAAVVKVARRFRASPFSLARWIVGLVGPFEADRDAIEKAAQKRIAARAGAVKA